ncbi:MAG: hypothetical protein ACOH1P_06590 [Lysobacter sp.]
MTPRNLLSSLLLTGLASLAAPALAQDAPAPENIRTTADATMAVTAQGEASTANALAGAMLQTGNALTQDVAAPENIRTTANAAMAVTAQGEAANATALAGGMLQTGSALTQDVAAPENLRTTANTTIAVTGQGEAAIADALAGAMLQAGTAADAKIAMATVNSLRAQGMGWGAVAQELGFSLGEQVSAVRADGRPLSISATTAADETARIEGVHVTTNGAAGAETAASARLNADVGVGTAAEVRAGAKVDVKAGGHGRPLIDTPTRPLRPVRALLPLRGR